MFLYYLKKLKPDKPYIMRVRAQNKSGFGQYSKEKYLKTKKMKTASIDSDFICFYDKSRFNVYGNGKTITGIGSSCNGYLLFGKYGIEKGIYRWYIKCNGTAQCYSSIGIKTFRDKKLVYNQTSISDSKGLTYFFNGMNHTPFPWGKGEIIKMVCTIFESFVGCAIFAKYNMKMIEIYNRNWTVKNGKLHFGVKDVMNILIIWRIKDYLMTMMNMEMKRMDNDKKLKIA